MGDGNKISLVGHDVMLTDLNNMTNYCVEWFWLATKVTFVWLVSF